MLAALAPASLARLRFPLGELTKPEVRELAREAGLPVADKRESQDLCFLAGTGKSAFLARHGGAARAAGRDRRPRRPRRSAATAASTSSRSASARGSASRPRSRSTCSPRTRGANTVTVGTRAELATPAVAVRDAVLHRPDAEVDRVKLRYRTTPLRVPRAAATPAAARARAGASRSTAPRPARSPA